MIKDLLPTMEALGDAERDIEENRDFWMFVCVCVCVCVVCAVGGVFVCNCNPQLPMLKKYSPR